MAFFTNSGTEAVELAIKAAEEALNAAKGDAEKFVPDQVKAVDDARLPAEARYDYVRVFARK